MTLPKVTVVGAGFVGATTAQRLIEKSLANVVLIDIVEGLPQGKALDMMEASAVEGYETKIIGTNDYKDTAGSDLVVITAGLARKPGMSRDDLLSKNAGIVNGVVGEIVKYSPKTILLVVTNPLDVMCYVAWKKSGFPKSRVLGMAGVLDTARYTYFISEACGCSVNEIQAMVLGGHGDAMVPLANLTTVKGKPISSCVDENTLNALHDRTRRGGAEIVSLLKTGSAFYAPSSSVTAMARSILRDDKSVFPSSVYLEGEYSLSGIFIGVPARLGNKGVEEVVEVDLTTQELEQLKRSAEGVKKNIEKISL